MKSAFLVSGWKVKVITVITVRAASPTVVARVVPPTRVLPLRPPRSILRVRVLPRHPLHLLVHGAGVAVLLHAPLVVPRGFDPLLRGHRRFGVHGLPLAAYPPTVARGVRVRVADRDVSTSLEPARDRAGVPAVFEPFREV